MANLLEPAQLMVVAVMEITIGETNQKDQQVTQFILLLPIVALEAKENHKIILK